MIRTTVFAAGAVTLALTLSTASFAQVTGPAGQQDQNKQGYANPNTPNMANDPVVVAPVPVPDGTVEPRTVGSAVSRPTEVVPAPNAHVIDGAESAPAGRY